MSDLSERDTEALAGFFLIWWAALVLAPRNNREVRSVLVDLGLVKPKGRLALTERGERALAHIQQSGKVAS